MKQSNKEQRELDIYYTKQTMKNLEIKRQEEIKLNSFLQKFRINKESKIQELEKLGQFSNENRIDFDLAEEILKNRIRLHKKGEQEYAQIINIMGGFIKSKLLINL